MTVAAPARGSWWARHGNTVQFAVAYCVVNLHTLRALASKPYLLAYGLVFAWLAIAYLRHPKRGVLTDRGFGMWIWIGLALWGLADSLVTISVGGALTGLARWFYAAPVFAALVLFTDSRRQLVRNIAVMVAFYVCAALTQPLQWLIGPIAWFPSPALRGDVTRYASLLGSLTVIGIVAGCYLLLTLLLKPAWRWPLIGLMIVPSVTSASKSGIVNIALALLVVLWFSRRDRRVLVGAGVVAVVAAVGAVALPQTRRILVAIWDSFVGKGDVTGATDNANLFQNVLGRLFELPSDQWITMAKASSVAPRIIGAGFGMGNTGLVPAQDALSEMAHNQLVEVMAVFGVVGALLVVGIMAVVLATLARLWRRTRDPLYAVVGWMFALFALNSVLASGTLFQPAAASLFYLGCYVALSEPVRRDALARLDSLRSLAERWPGGATTREPSSATTREPSAATTREPSAATTREPSAATTREPSSATTREPSAPATRRPSAAEANREEL